MKKRGDVRSSVDDEIVDFLELSPYLVAATFKFGRFLVDAECGPDFVYAQEIVDGVHDWVA